MSELWSFTDFWAVNTAVLPSKGYRVVDKENGRNSHIKRFKNPFRQWM